MKPRFTIRELILITAIVALALGWWIDSRAKEAARMAQKGQNDFEIRWVMETSDRIRRIEGKLDSIDRTLRAMQEANPVPSAPRPVN